MTLREYLFGENDITDWFEEGEFIIFETGSGIIKGENDTWLESLGPVKNENDWINPQPISKPISHYLNLTVTNVCNYNRLG